MSLIAQCMTVSSTVRKQWLQNVTSYVVVSNVIGAHVGVTPSNFSKILWRGLMCGVVCVILCLAILAPCRLVIDRRTVRQTDRWTHTGLHSTYCASIWPLLTKRIAYVIATNSAASPEKLWLPQLCVFHSISTCQPYWTRLLHIRYKLLILYLWSFITICDILLLENIAVAEDTSEVVLSPVIALFDGSVWFHNSASL